ncbi:MAG TPA: hypothetical protein VM513_25285 [Kofleriaceae bacterium]|nr:hypothetical protein [Kofleriaceae bacterium]
MGRRLSLLVAVIAVAAAVTSVRGHRRTPPREPIARTVAPASLRESGLYADWASKTVAAANRPFSPQYPLWTDGARKQRWIYLPPGAVIDATNADAWQFPVGTKLWKEFSFGRRTETRYMERAAHGWIYATYVWNADESDATLAPPRGTLAATEVAAGVRHAIPSDADCRACHANSASPVLGFSALQLSADRDPQAPHAERPEPGALALPELIASGIVRGIPAWAAAPRIGARTPEERAALGYLHGNCGGCHRADGPLASLGMVLAQSVGQPSAVLATTSARASQFTTATAHVRIVPGAPAQSVLVARIGSRVPATQMPPLGSQLVDDVAVELVTRWIAQLAPTPSEGAIR